MQPQDLITKQATLIELWNVQPKEIIREGLQHAEHQTKLAEIECVAANMAEAYLILAKYFYKWKTTMLGIVYFLSCFKIIAFVLLQFHENKCFSFYR